MSKESMENAIASYFTNLQEMNPEGWLKNFTEDAVLYDPIGKPPSNVREDYQKFFGLLSMIFAKLAISADHIFIAGNGAAVKWTMRGEGKNGRQGTAEGISVFDFNEVGKIKQVDSYWDDAAMMAQIRGEE